MKEIVGDVELLAMQIAQLLHNEPFAEQNSCFICFALNLYKNIYNNITISRIINVKIKHSKLNQNIYVSGKQ